MSSLVSVDLPKVIVDEVRRRAEEAGVSVEEYLLDLVLKDSDPKASATKYVDKALQLLEQARVELGNNDFRQASEKIWGACALAIKAYALAKRGIRLETHRDLWVYKNEVAEELGSWVAATFRQADSMHKNFYENLATREDVEDVLKDVEKLVKTIAEKIGELSRN